MASFGAVDFQLVNVTDVFSSLTIPDTYAVDTRDNLLETVDIQMMSPLDAILTMGDIDSTEFRLAGTLARYTPPKTGQLWPRGDLDARR